jgi:hypothetical protein
MQGIVEREVSPETWLAIVRNETRVRELLPLLGLDLILDDVEGYAFVRQRAGQSDVPRLVARRPLSLPVSLVLVILRRRLLELDHSGGAVRLVLSTQEIVDALAPFLKDVTNEARVVDKIVTHLRKVEELGFVRRLEGADDKWEVRRVLKQFVTASFLQELDEKLASYRATLNTEQPS